ncbi:MAG TPA: hypothetical protein VKR42_08270 [Ktedonobacteraceae bacterium]|nr:hypothetical protein [Ktedonobacteraceae bacterium]
MAEIDIVELVWDNVNEAHIWERHQITRAEVEEVCYSNAENLHAENTYGGRYLVVGPKRGNRLYAIVLAPKGRRKFYPVSARRASVKEQRKYREWKEGTQK